MDPAISCRRSDFTLPPDEHYLNCAYMSPLPKEVERAGLEGLRRKRWPAAIGPDDFFEDLHSCRSAFAELIGASEPSRVSVIPSVSYGVATVAQNVRLSGDQRIVVAGQQFPSNYYAWRRLASESGASLVEVPLPEPGQGSMTAAMLDAVDDSTALVAIGTVHWTDGRKFDLPSISARVRKVGAMLVIDGTQSVGAVPFDIEEVRPDALICAGYKWLLAPYGIAVAWYGPALDGGRPLEETWLSRPDSEDFARLVDYRAGYRKGSARYDMGEASSFVLLPSLLAAIRLILRWRVASIAEYLDALTDRIAGQAAELGYLVAEKSHRAPHMIGVRLPTGGDAARLRQLLEQARVHVSLRGSAVRVSPHLYNDQGDIDALLEVLRSARKHF